MISKKRVVLVGSAVLGLCSFSAVVTQEQPADAAQILTDRCSGEVAFTPTYGSNPTAHGTVILKRQGDGYSPPSTFTVKPDADGYVRWWCHSTIGNVFDAGTWRVHVNGAEMVGCLLSGVDPINADSVIACKKSITISSSAFSGWTPERSRCNDHKGHLTARLGPDRLLTTECL